LAHTVRVIEEVPCAIVMLVGTLTTAGSLLERAITNPPEGAGALSVTVRTAEAPTATFGRSTLIPLKAIGTTVRVAVFLTPSVAEITTARATVTALVVTAKAAVLSPAAMLTLDGTFAVAVLELVNWMTTPPVGAGPVSVTVPVDPLPPPTSPGLNDTALTTGAFTFSVPALVMPLKVAETLPVV